MPLLLIVLLAGCAPNAREPDALALVRVLGVDGAGPFVLTAVCGTGESGEEALRGSARGKDFQAAREALPWAGDRELALTSLSYIIVGADTDLKAVAEAVLADHELSPGASVWLAESAAELLGACDDAEGRLAVLEEKGLKPPTAAEVLAALKTDGSVSLPLLVWDGERMETAGSVRWEGTK